ncbi:GNAT family N-acetyltransferase [Mycetohabitans sp. B8]|uniref:GNAT family N-acetyltransferase n=1 Tax=Mycetohabitans sp. B8 TaxID=2841845 RepID=UPI001F3749AB|nr:GNAT family N-acetyltransferase [Mycetohabitans sp. B8]MCG1041267.1 GNAT family N-acetyltransferase [Mycetohabitans sp. B8]
MTLGSALLPGMSTVRDSEAIATSMERVLNDLAPSPQTDPLRLLGTNEMVDYFKNNKMIENTETFSYQLNDQNVGLVRLKMPKKKDGDMEVMAMVTDPRTRGVGSTFMQQAMNHAVKMTGQPVLTLNAMDRDAAAAYERMGFKADSDYDSDDEDQMIPMRLDASNSDKWEKNNTGNFQLKSRLAPEFR